VYTKILLAVGMVAALAASVGLLGMLRLTTVSRQAEHVYSAGIQPILRIQRVYEEALKAKADIALHANAENDADLVRHEKSIATDLSALDAALADYEAGPHRGVEDGHLSQFKQAWVAYQEVYAKRLQPAARANDDVGWNEAYEKEAVPLGDAAIATLQELQQVEAAGAKVNADASAQQAGSARRLVLIVLALGLALAIAAALYVARLIVTPLKRVAGVIDAMAHGDLTKRVDLDSRDEVGAMARAVDAATESMRTALQTIDQSASSLGEAAAEMSATSSRIVASAAESSAQAGIVVSAAEEVSRNVQTVASSSEEMGASIREIAQNANEAVKVAAQAVAVAEETNLTVGKLGDSSTEIGNVVKVITSIAEQTNLLALNATIEAARAGEAGKGFAVVANEVKDLAQETARATKDISRRVDAIQADTAGAVDAIAEISRIIGLINDYQLTIASAVEEQTATTNEMNRNVSDAATGSTEIASNISGVAAAAAVTTQGVTDSQRSVDELSRMSAQLQTLVGRFQV
jgi:methyl-accepting chemotaxis protein